jgi:hypothetical protein
MKLFYKKLSFFRKLEETLSDRVEFFNSNNPKKGRYYKNRAIRAILIKK